MTSLYKSAKHESKQFKSWMKQQTVASVAPATVFKQGYAARQMYQNLILKNPDATDAGMRAHRSLWKECFYTYISGMRAHLSASEMVTSRRPRQRLAAFIDLAITYYEELFSCLQRASSKSGVADRSQSMLRTLVYLGDLARYRSRETDDGRCTDAHEFYQRAVRAFPHDGNPHNQLAVLATYQKFSLNAVYHYCRALTVRFPFHTARANLERLFHKEVPGAVALAEDEIAIKRHWRECSQSGQSVGPAQKNKMRRLLMCRFVQFHGSLLTGSMSNVGALLSDLVRIKGSLSQLLSRCFSQNLLHHGIVLKMIVISTFSVLDMQSRKPKNDDLAKFAWEAFGLLLRLMCAYVVGDIASLDTLTPQVSKRRGLKKGKGEGKGQGQGKRKGDQAAPDLSSVLHNLTPMLRPIAIAARWVHVLHMNIGATDLNWAHCPVPIQRVILRSLTSVVNWAKDNVLTHNKHENMHGQTAENGMMLPEDAELVGWSPLEPCRGSPGELPAFPPPGSVVKEPRAMCLRGLRLQAIALELVRKPDPSAVYQPAVFVEYMVKTSTFRVTEASEAGARLHQGQFCHRVAESGDSRASSSSSSAKNEFLAEDEVSPLLPQPPSYPPAPLAAEIAAPALLPLSPAPSAVSAVSSIEMQEDDGEDEIVLGASSMWQNPWPQQQVQVQQRAQHHHEQQQQQQQQPQQPQQPNFASASHSVWQPFQPQQPQQPQQPNFASASHSVWQAPTSSEPMLLDQSEWEEVEGMLKDVLAPFTFTKP